MSQETWVFGHRLSTQDDHRASAAASRLPHPGCLVVIHVIDPDEKRAARERPTFLAAALFLRRLERALRRKRADLEITSTVMIGRWESELQRAAERWDASAVLFDGRFYRREQSENVLALRTPPTKGE